MPGQCHCLGPVGTARKEKATQNWAPAQTVETEALGCGGGGGEGRRRTQSETVPCCVAYQDTAGYVLTNENATKSQAPSPSEAHWPNEGVRGGSIWSPKSSTLGPLQTSLCWCFLIWGPRGWFEGAPCSVMCPRAVITLSKPELYVKVQ